MGSSGALDIVTFGSARAASTRYRVLQFLPYLEAAGITAHIADGPGSAPACWIQKKLLPLATVLRSARRQRLVFDFDDAIWTTEKGQRSFIARLRTEARLKSILRRSALVLAGNDHLARYARRYSAHVRVVPTVLDTARYPVREHRASETITLGWIGHSVNFRYLEALGPVIRRVAAQGPTRLLVVADRDFALEGVAVENRRWSEETEVADLLAMDIGLMPLADDEWTRGKCGFKAIQYMAAGVPPVASPVGMNRQLLEDGVDGFLAADDAGWLQAIGRLHGDAALRTAMGARARAKVEAHYSLAGWGPVVSGLFADLLRTGQ